jgi:hypothetical protein
MSPLLILGLILLVVFGGLGLVAKAFFWGLVIALALMIAGAMIGRR